MNFIRWFCFCKGAYWWFGSTSSKMFIDGLVHFSQFDWLICSYFSCFIVFFFSLTNCTYLLCFNVFFFTVVYQMVLFEMICILQFYWLVVFLLPVCCICNCWIDSFVGCFDHFSTSCRRNDSIQAITNKFSVCSWLHDERHPVRVERWTQLCSGKIGRKLYF